MFPACYGLANPLCAHISRMIVVERGLNILGAPIAERPAQPGFRRRTDGPYTWISFLKAFILSNPRVAATFTVLRATVSGTLVPPYAGPFLFMALTEHARDTTEPETSALPPRPRFNGACPLSSAADRPMPAKNAGSSITVTCASARSQDASATRLTLTPGNRVADSIPAVSPASARATPPKRSTRPVATSKRHGWCFYRSELRPTFRNGAMRERLDGREVPPLRSRRADAARLEAVARCGGLVKSRQGWKRPFDDPIPLLRGHQLVTLKDAAKLYPEASQGRAGSRGVAGRGRSLAAGRRTQQPTMIGVLAC